MEFIRCSSTRQINPKHSKSLNYRQFRDVLNSVGLGNVSTLSNRVSFLDCVCIVVVVADSLVFPFPMF